MTDLGIAALVFSASVFLFWSIVEYTQGTGDDDES
jgi:hypothetical protein